MKAIGLDWISGGGENIEKQKPLIKIFFFLFHLLVCAFSSHTLGGHQGPQCTGLDSSHGAAKFVKLALLFRPPLFFFFFFHPIVGCGVTLLR